MERLSALERLPAHATDEGAAAVRRDGAVVLEGVWPAETVDQLRTVVLEQHPEFSDPALLQDFLGIADERFVAPVTLTSRIVEAGLLDAPGLEALAGALLGNDYVYEAFGMLMVHPGVAEQGPHRDGGLLFPEAGIDRILPPTALTIAIPLVDVDADFAPTGIAPGTHRTLVAPEEAVLEPVTLRRGDIAVWDFRVVHAGLANRTDRPRPALYLTACRPFWLDHRNFVKTAGTRLAASADLMDRMPPRFLRAQQVS